MKVLFGLLLLVSLGYSRALPKELDISLGMGAGLHYSWFGPRIETRYFTTKYLGLGVALNPISKSFNTMIWLDFKRLKYGIGPVFGHQIMLNDECISYCGKLRARKDAFYGFDLVSEYDIGSYEGVTTRGGVGVLVFEDYFSSKQDYIIIFPFSLGVHYQW